jgi:hypothetical protein
VDNPDVFRSLNERIAETAPARLELVCECDAEQCTERLVITPVEFHEVRRHNGWYVVRPGHEHDGHVVERAQSFVVVTTAASG